MCCIILGQYTGCRGRYPSVLLWEDRIWIHPFLRHSNNLSAKSCQQEAMARRTSLDITCYTARSEHCCGNVALGRIFRAEQAKQSTTCVLWSSASSQLIRIKILKKQCLTLGESTLSTPRSCGLTDLLHVPGCSAFAAMPCKGRKAGTPMAKST